VQVEQKFLVLTKDSRRYGICKVPCSRGPPSVLCTQTCSLGIHLEKAILFGVEKKVVTRILPIFENQYTIFTII